MKKKIFTFLKVIGVIFSLLLVFLIATYFVSVNYSTYPIKVTTLETQEINTDSLASAFHAQMNLEEKIDQLYGEKMMLSMPKFLINFLVKQRFPHIYVGGNERLNIPPWVLSDGPRGARVMAKDISAVTTFPVAMSRGASWDIGLEERIHDVIGKEMRANGTNYGATPCINLLRHPAWGRAQETYGEDPWLLGEFGVAAVNGLEQNNVMACPKHFALNSIENSRWVIDVKVDDRSLREVYLPHFKKVIQKGKPASIMSAYNQVNGDFSGESKTLLTDILRKEWGFEGFVSTDWMFGLYDGIKGIKAGLDVEMPFQNAYSQETLEEGIAAGEITENDIDTLVLRSLKTRLKYAYAKDKIDYNKELILKPEHVALAKEAAEKGMVLLKNENILPFSSEGNKTIAVIGKLADAENTGDLGSSNSTPPYVVTPYQGIKNYHDALGNTVVYDDGTDIERASKLIASADDVILVVGYSHLDEGEYMITSRDAMETSAKAKKLIGEKGIGGDRSSLKLNIDDELMIYELAELNPNTVLTYVGGSAIDLSTLESKVPAILFAWYGGMEGGNALANILYGKANPSGKLPFTIAKDPQDYPYFNPYIDEITYDYYHGYTLFDKTQKEVAYPFGYGLSYTDFSYSDLSLDTTVYDKNGTVTATVKLTNTGDRAGEEVVQLYVGFKNSAVDRPIKLLRGFKKIALEAKETKEVQLSVAVDDLAWYNPDTKAWEIENMIHELYIGSSSDPKDLLASSFEIE